jgi:peptidoglycan/LPS O-acetylase OafA/YrhL
MKSTTISPGVRADAPGSPAAALLPHPATSRRAHRLERRAPNSSARAFYRPELDVLRFFAFVGVFAVHVFNYPIDYLQARHIPSAVGHVLMGIVRGGSYGVDLFFALSAYLITELLLREKEEAGGLHVRSFYLRRALRIWPLYYFVIVLAAAVPFFDPLQQFTANYVVLFLIFMGNWGFVWYGWPISPADPLWSVSIEEQFYLVWPLLIARLSRRGIVYTCAALIAIANAVRLWAAATGQGKEHLWSNTLAHLDTIALGILLALWLRGKALPLRLRTRVAMIGVGLACFISRGYCIMLPDGDRMSVAGTLVGYPAVMLGCAAILLAFIGLPLKSKVLRYLGKISYGLYVSHMFCMLVVDQLLPVDPGIPRVIVRALLIFSLTLVFSAASYRLLESPFLSFKRRFTFVQSRPV